MSMMTLGLGEASSRPARSRAALPEETRPHVWAADDRCRRCAMHRTWDGAKAACTGIDGLDKTLARKRERSRAAGEGTPGYVPVERLPEGAWSEHGQRVEAALAAAEVAVARAELASLRGRGAET